MIANLLSINGSKLLLNSRALALALQWIFVVWSELWINLELLWLPRGEDLGSALALRLPGDMIPCEQDPDEPQVGTFPSGSGNGWYGSSLTGHHFPHCPENSVLRALTTNRFCAVREHPEMRPTPHLLLLCPWTPWELCNESGFRYQA